MAQSVMAHLAALRPILLGLVIGTIGGVVFIWLNMPLPWMLGAMTATTIASIAGVRQRMPGNLRSVMVVVLGVMLGSSFTPDIVQHMAAWVVSLIGVAIYVVLCTGLVMVMFRKWLGHDPLTAFLCATPGGASEMVILGITMGADERAIALSQASRVLIVMLAIPFWFRFVEGYIPPAQVSADFEIFTLGIADMALLAGCGVVGAVGAHWLGIPVPAMIGPLFVSAAAHIAGLSDHRPPWELVAVAQVVLGTAVGCRFAGVSAQTIVRTLGTGIVSSAILLAMTTVFSYGLYRLTGLGMQGLVLAFAPGGLAEMNLIALAMGIDPAFVSTHHTARICIVVIFMPWLLRLYVRHVLPPGSQ
ncbi:MAG: AbrB family transcriptional regulator [Alphaproteobacteria bacterium]|nr:AbrB family transcriptional regulator [Alphaproteobacteria bacterium]